MRKPRSDSKLLNLPHHQQDALATWLLDEGFSYADAKERLHMDFGVTTSEAALNSFWVHVCSPRQFARIAAASEAAPALTDGLDSNFGATTEAYVNQQLFLLAASPNPDQKLLATYAAIKSSFDQGRLDRAKLAFAEHRHAETNALKTQDLALQREKFETSAAKLAMEHAAEIKTITATRSLDADAKVEHVRQLLFGVQPTEGKS